MTLVLESELVIFDSLNLNEMDTEYKFQSFVNTDNLGLHSSKAKE